jgi:hypothetical protein
MKNAPAVNNNLVRDDLGTLEDVQYTVDEARKLGWDVHFDENYAEVRHESNRSKAGMVIFEATKRGPTQWAMKYDPNYLSSF